MRVFYADFNPLFSLPLPPLCSADITENSSLQSKYSSGGLYWPSPVSVGRAKFVCGVYGVSSYKLFSLFSSTAIMDVEALEMLTIQ